MPGVFISYRRRDGGGFAARVYEHIAHDLGHSLTCFFDFESIRHNEDFARVIERAVASCDAALVIIGPDWLSIKDAGGELRLNNPDDWVRYEVLSVLKKPEGTVFPVLVGGAVMPAASELSDDLRPLSRVNAITVTDQDFDVDCAKLAAEVEEFLGRKYPLWRVRRKLARMFGSSGSLVAVVIAAAVLTLAIDLYFMNALHSSDAAFGPEAIFVFLFFLAIGLLTRWILRRAGRRKELL